MPETGGNRSGKPHRKQTVPGSSRDAPGKKKTSMPANREKSPGSSVRSNYKKKADDSYMKSEADIVRAPAHMSGSGSKLINQSRSEASPSSFKIPDREVAPIRDLMMKAASEKQAAVRPKDPKPKPAKEPPPPSPLPKPKNTPQIDMEAARKKAADAAMSRLDHTNRNMGFVRDNPSEATRDQLAVQSVLHVCPVVSQQVLHSRDWRPKIITYLVELGRTEKELGAVLTIHTLNPNKEKVEECVQILTTYLKNIIANPDEEKYRTIKTTNRVFSEKVVPIKGAVDVLNAAGFKKEDKPDSDGSKMEVLYLQGNPDLDKLEMLIDALKSAEPVLPQVYRDPMVLKPQEAEERVYLPGDFYDLTEKELTEMYKKNLQKIEEESPLMTKAMREKEERKHIAKYKYTVLRIRFPDSAILQGTFGRLDTQKSVKEFVNWCLIKPFKYSLFSPLTKSPLLDMNDDKTLLDLKLVPSVILNFIPEDKGKFPKVYLRADLTKKITTS